MKKLNASGEYEYGIYEVYYDDNNNIQGWSENSMTPICSSENELLDELEIMKEAFQKDTLLYDK